MINHMHVHVLGQHRCPACVQLDYTNLRILPANLVITSIDQHNKDT